MKHEFKSNKKKVKHIKPVIEVCYKNSIAKITYQNCRHLIWH